DRGGHPDHRLGAGADRVHRHRARRDRQPARRRPRRLHPRDHHRGFTGVPAARVPLLPPPLRVHRGDRNAARPPPGPHRREEHREPRLVTGATVTRHAKRGGLFLWPIVPPAALALVVTLLVSRGGAYMHSILILGLINLLFVIGLYSFAGTSGVFSFGHIAFAAIGACSAGIF